MYQLFTLWIVNSVSNFNRETELKNAQILMKAIDLRKLVALLLGCFLVIFLYMVSICAIREEIILPQLRYVAYFANLKIEIELQTCKCTYDVSKVNQSDDVGCDSQNETERQRATHRANIFR